MQNASRLLITLAKATLIAGAVAIVFDVIVVERFLEPCSPRVPAMVATILLQVIPAIGAAWWMARKLRASFMRRETITIAIVFAIVTPVALLVGTPFNYLPEQLSDLLSPRIAIPVVWFAGALALTTLANFLVSRLALWVFCRHSKAEGSIT
jgi:hypothetical protein